MIFFARILGARKLMKTNEFDKQTHTHTLQNERQRVPTIGYLQSRFPKKYYYSSTVYDKFFLLTRRPV